MIGDDLKLWQKAAILLAAPLALEFVVFFNVFHAQEQVNRAQQLERAAQKRLFTTGVQGMRLVLDSVSDIFNYRSGRKEGSLIHCQKRVGQLKKMREDFARDSADFVGTPLDLVMLEVQELLEKVIREPDADYNGVDFRNLSQISRLASKAIRANQKTQAKLVYEHDLQINLVEQRQQELKLLLSISVVVTAVFALCLGLIYQQGTAKQIGAVMENVTRLSRREKLLPELSGQSELAVLDRVFHSMASDIEALTARERSVLTNSNELILLINSEMKVELASHSSMAILNRTPEDMIGLRASVLSPKFAEQLQATKESGESRFEVSFDDIENKSIELEFAVSWSDAEQSYYCVGHDIGARKELERMKQSFISMVSHDLRSPISASQAALQVLSSDSDCCKLNEEGEKLVNRMMASNTRLLSMITDLLDIEKLDYGLIELDYELVTFNDLMYECMSSLETLALAKGIKLTVDDSDTFIYCDSNRIVQVLINIASNAVKVSKSGSVIEMRFRENESVSIISIIDHGPGIPADFIPQLFDRFSQLSSNKELAKQGSGLGLSVAKKLVDLHRGSINVTSEVGSGTTFEVSLPKRA